MTSQRLPYLFQQFLHDRITVSELEEFRVLVQDESQTESLDQLLEELYLNAAWREESDLDRETVFAEIKSRLSVPVVRRMGWWKVAVAVCLLVVGWWFLVRGPKSEVGSEVGGPETGVVADVPAPASNKARVTLADGRIVSLDSLQRGLLVDQQGVQLIKQADGKIVYQYTGLSSSDPRPLTNTLTNPRGSKVIDLTLSDGTRVWLNAGSSITYPVSFSRSERRVEMTGEGYFEVRSQKKPFIVQKGDMQVQVLGTHFNVNAYDDESEIKVTLLEGSVKVSTVNGQRSTVIKPGEQAILAENGQLTTDNQIDIEQVMAWKNGKFDFGDHSSLQDIMRQLARWYDVEIEYKGKIDQEFWGSVSRTENISRVLEKFELTGRVHFKIEGRKIIVSP